MSDVKRQPLWKRRHTLKPGEAALLGVAIGCAVATISAFTPPRDFSYSFLMLLLLSLGPCAGIAGYMLWLSFDPVREQRLRRITSIVAFPAIIGLLVAFPDFWREVRRTLGPHMVWISIGFIFAMVGFAVAAGLGIVHLVDYLAFSVRQSNKAAAASQTDGVWDRELDQG